MRRHHDPRRLSHWLELAGSAIVVVALIVVGRAWLPNTDGASGGIPSGVRTIVDGAFADEECSSPVDAQASLERALTARGYPGWTVVITPAAVGAACVAATMDAAEQSVSLIPAIRPAVRTALAQVSARLLAECLGRDSAVELVRRTLDAVGETGYVIRTDGPVVFPVESRELVMNHVNAGCWIYATTGWTDSGQRIYYVSGR